MQTHRNTELYKYNLLIAELRKKIYSGSFSEKGKLPTERNLAETFGVSRVTIRAAIKQLKEEDIIEQIQGKGTFIKAFSDKVPEKQTKSLKVCCVCLEAPSSIEADPYYSQIFLGFFRGAAKSGFEFSPLQIPPDKKISPALLKSGKYDGFIFVNYSLDDSEINYLNDFKIKFVQLGENDSPRRIPTVDIDNFSGSYQAISHLLESGKTSPLLLYGQCQSMPGRLAGYEAALKARGLAVKNNLIQQIEGESIECAESHLSLLFKQKLAFDSILVIGDWATMGVINCLKKKRIKIPREIAVITYDSFQWIINGVKPRLTSVFQPFAQMSEHAAYMLRNLIDDPTDEIPIKILKPRLIVRESTTGM